MSDVGGSSAEPDAQTFMAWVDEAVTPAMTGLGYHRIVVPRSGSARRLVVGFEADSGDVMRRVDADDPDSAAELWLSYEPVTGRLDLHDLADVAGSPLDWDIRRDSGPCAGAEVRRRLHELGSAVHAFAATTGGPGDTS